MRRVYPDGRKGPMKGPIGGGLRVRVLSSLRARLALLVLVVAVPAALLIHFFAVRAGEALLAQHPGSNSGSGHALLGQEILGLLLLGTVALAAAWIGSRLLVVRDPGKLLSAGVQLAACDPRSRTGKERDRGGEVGRLTGGLGGATSAVESPEPPFRDTLSALWKFWREAQRAVELAEADKERQSVPQASASETPPP